MKRRSILLTAAAWVFVFAARPPNLIIIPATNGIRIVDLMFERSQWMADAAWATSVSSTRSRLWYQTFGDEQQKFCFARVQRLST